jgi:hypothetical protein
VARQHIVALASLLIAATVGYTLLAIVNPATATAIGIGYIGFILAASLLLRLMR